MNSITTIGLIAATLTTISFLPQVMKVLKTKQTKDLSLTMYLTFTTGITLWLIYGLAIQDLPITIANSITLILSTIILITKLKYK